MKITKYYFHLYSRQEMRGNDTGNLFTKETCNICSTVILLI